MSRHSGLAEQKLNANDGMDVQQASTARISMLSTFSRDDNSPLPSGDVSDITDDENDQASLPGSAAPSRNGSQSDLIKQAITKSATDGALSALAQRRQVNNKDASTPSRLSVMTDGAGSPSVAQSTPHSGDSSPAFPFNEDGESNTDAEASRTAPEASEPVVQETQTKEYWLALMTQKDAEMAAVRHELEKLKGRITATEAEIEEAKRKRRLGIEAPDMVASLGKESVRALIKRIYNQNKLAAEESHPEELRDNAVVKQHQHTEPADYAVVKAVTAHDHKFKARLMEYLSATLLHDKALERRLAQQYHQHKRRWKRALRQRFDATKAEIVKRREYFETVFPAELKRVAVEQPVPMEIGETQRVTRKQTADSALFVDVDADPNLLKFKGQIVKCPPQMLGYERQRQAHVRDHNGIVEDSLDVHQQLANVNVWTQDEATIFFQRFMLHPKRFHKISAALPNKTTAECVKYYYLHKKRLKFKEERDKQRRLKAEKAAAAKAARAERSKARALAQEQAQLEARLKREAMKRERAENAMNDDEDDNDDANDGDENNDNDDKADQARSRPLPRATDVNGKRASSTSYSQDSKRSKSGSAKTTPVGTTTSVVPITQPVVNVAELPRQHSQAQQQQLAQAQAQAHAQAQAQQQQLSQIMAYGFPMSSVAGVPLQLTNQGATGQFLPASVATSQPLMMAANNLRFAANPNMLGSLLPVHSIAMSQAQAQYGNMQRLMQQQQQQHHQQQQQAVQQHMAQQMTQQMNAVAQQFALGQLVSTQTAQQQAAAAAETVAKAQLHATQAHQHHGSQQ
eukprot:TRINITY_DN8612_c0_g1_i4.p1 TRINITY_DN8612_c0_g1~~TRINITY_DN8612_c0_g1_i4.p1  ORF type:complete len:802 (+),score=288.92 TRINITY_DN8612_c0_g1_i4:45-2450(+)